MHAADLTCMHCMQHSLGAQPCVLGCNLDLLAAMCMHRGYGSSHHPPNIPKALQIPNES